MGTTSSSKKKHTAPSTPQKRSRGESQRTPQTGSSSKPIELYDSEEEQSPPTKTKKIAKAKPAKNAEKRLKRLRSSAPIAWQERLERALTQRYHSSPEWNHDQTNKRSMFVIDRQRHSKNGFLQEVIELAGSTGNVYTVTISHVPRCTCQDALRGHECKHIIYVLRLVLKAPSNLEYQAAFLTEELATIFAAAPLPIANTATTAGNSQDETDAETGATHRKPVTGDCPICFMDFGDGAGADDDVVWCKALCGNNVHRICFEKWAKSHDGRDVRCVYCRAVWKGDEPSLDRIRAAKTGRTANREGYVNLASELGLSTTRDTSTYHSFWVRGQQRAGHDFSTR